MTYIPTREGWLYLAVVLDLFSRRIVGWSMGETITAELACRALDMAWYSRVPAPGLIFHSDRGSQYASGCYTDLLAGHGIKASMSRKGNCWDKACSETLFGSLKVERLHGMDFKSHREGKEVTLDWRPRLIARSRVRGRSSAVFEMSGTLPANWPLTFTVLLITSTLVPPEPVTDWVDETDPTPLPRPESGI